MDSKDAGSSKTVNFVDFALEGVKVENYTLISQPTPIKANITKRPVNILGINSSNKTYDSYTDAQITGSAIISNKIESDNVEVKYGKAHFSDKNSGFSKKSLFQNLILSVISPQTISLNHSR